MQSTQFNQPPQIPLKAPQGVFDTRPLQYHGQQRYGLPAAEARALRMPAPDLLPELNMHYPTKLTYRPGYTENKKPIYNYPEMTGVFMRPPALRDTNHQIALISSKTYEIEQPQVVDRLNGAAPLRISRTWDEAYPRYMY